jgi:hypothetical protein
VIRRKLEPGEQILWCARARPWVAARQPLFMIAFAILLAAFIIVIPAAPVGNVGGKGFIGLCMCLYLIVRGVLGLINCIFTIYALTDRRLIIEAPLAPLHSLTGDGILSLSRFGSDARGTVMIAYRVPPFTAHEYMMNTRLRPRYFGLYGIQAPAKVETLIRETLLSRSSKITGEAA